MNSKLITSIFIYIVIFVIGACQNAEPQIIYITATPNQVAIATETTAVLPTVENTAALPELSNAVENNNSYIVKVGDTLSGIAAEYDTSIDNLMQLNDITNADLIEVGQLIKLPEAPTQITPSTMLLVNSRFIPQPQTLFDVREFLDKNGGAFIREYEEVIIQRAADGSAYEYTLGAASIIEEISSDFSVDARLLIAILEYRADYLSAEVLEESIEKYPLISFEDSRVDRSGLYRQISWTANELNRAYYSSRYSDSQKTLEFVNGTRLLQSTDLNSATSALQYFFSLNNTYDQWLNDLDTDGFIEIYRTYFGNPVAGDNSMVPAELSQPIMQLPFEIGDTWYFTGGAHGGWGNGSAWSAIDFAPPDNNNLLCYVSAYWITAVADGIIAKSERGMVVLDLDGDGDELTGWNVVYLHVATQSRIPQGTIVKKGDRIGHASCEGGYSTATHLHIARKYNGEWIPADCSACSTQSIEPFSMSDWSVVSLPNQEYQGHLINSLGDLRTAEQGRNTTINQIQLRGSS